MNPKLLCKQILPQWVFFRQRSPKHVIGRSFLLWFLLLAAGIALVGTRYLSHQQASARITAQAALEVIADLKIQQMVNWRNERLKDGRLLRALPYTARRALDAMAQPDSVSTRLMFTGSLAPLLASGDYKEALLLDEGLNVRIVHPSGASTELGETVRRAATRAALTREVVMTDLHQAADSNQVHLCIIVPLVVRRDGTRISVPAAGSPPSSADRSAGVLVLRISANDFLFPLIQRWPTPSLSAETLLVRREGNEVLFLNEPRHRKGTAMTLRRPLDDVRLPAARGARGETGIQEGVDYRGVPVVAVVRPVPDTPWLMVAKVDQAELYAPLRRQALTVGVVALTLLLIAALAVTLLWRRRKESLLREQLQAEQEQRALSERAKEELRQSEAKYRTLVENIPQKIFLKDRHSRYVSVNGRYASDLGLRPDQVPGCEDFAFFPKDLANKYRADDQRIMTAGVTEEYDEAYVELGEQRFIHTIKTPVRDVDGRVIGILGVFSDITERRQAEAALQESERRLKETQRMAQLGHWKWDIATGKVEWSEEVFNIFRLDPKTFTPQINSILSLSPWPEDHERDNELIQKAMISREKGHYDQRFLFPDGSIGYYHSTFQGVYDEGGNLISIVGTVLDVTERKRAEGALRESERQWQTTFDAIADGVILLAADDSVLKSNTAAERLLGKKATELLGRRYFEVLHGAREPVPGCPVVAARRTKRRACMELPLGDQLYNVTVDPLLDSQSQFQGAVHVITNITERKRLEQERAVIELKLRQQQKLESIGTLAGGVAHEINNPVNGIMNYAQLIQDRLPAESPLKEFTGEILHETHRVAAIVRNLLTFARDEKQSHSPARICDIVESTLSLIRTVIRHDQIGLTVDVPEDLPEMKCRSQQLQQVLMNLVTNARDALNQRYPSEDPDKVIRLSARLMEKAGRRWIRVTVEDHGTGITPEVRERMFDPFFTTKPRDRGTGLGLAISHGIVKEHLGELTVETEPGKLTRMHVDLPVDNGWQM
jgi:PAS domain S-box-containing protein